MPGESTTSAAAIAEEAAGSVATLVLEDPPPEPLPPPGPARVDLAAAALEPWGPQTDHGRSAAAIHRALTHLDAGEHEQTLVALGEVSEEWPVPDLTAWLRARTLHALDRPGDLGAVLATIPTDSRFHEEAQLLGAQLALDAEEPGAVLALLGEAPAGDVVYGALEGRADMLRAQAFTARAADGDLALAIDAAKRAWTRAPRTQADADASTFLDAQEPAAPAALGRSLTDAVARAESLGRRHANKDIVALLDSRRSELAALGATDPAAACAGLFQLGRAWHKQRTYAQSVTALQAADTLCPPGDDRVKAIYLLAQGRARSGGATGGIATFLRLPDEFPEHSYADDGLWQASRLALDEGRPDEARQHAERLVAAFDAGDMVGPTLWNLAWSAISAKRPADALPWLDAMAAADPRGPQRDRSLTGRYWRARIQLDLHPEAPEEALAALESLMTEHPLDWYGSLAGWRLATADPVRATAAAERLGELTETLRAADREVAVFTPLQEFIDQPAAQRGLALLRGGLLGDAAAEWSRALGPDPLVDWADADTWLFASHVLASSGDHHGSHNLLRMAFREEFPALIPANVPLLTHAYPQAFADVIEEHTADYTWEPLLFQGLVREESAFSPTVVSWAGAIGLSQLMWPTAKETARRMGIRGLRRADLRDPSTNASIGTTYFDGLAGRWRGHLPLAVASYNAGPGAVNRWIEARGELDLDAWVETIPYDQTRHYVKRVVGSWQIYRVLYGETDPLVPLRIGPVAQAVGRADPAPLTTTERTADVSP